MKHTAYMLGLILAMALGLSFIMLAPIFAPGAETINVSTDAAFAELMVRFIVPALAFLVLFGSSVWAYLVHRS